MFGFSGGLYLLGLIFGSDDLRDAGIGCASAEKAQSMMQSTVYCCAVRTAANAALRRRRRFGPAVGRAYIIAVPVTTLAGQ